MADNAESSGDAQITFKVKTSSDSTHTITMPEAATVLDLKTKLAGEAYENIPVERQRLIYSGRVMKNDDALSNYKIKHNNTIHMVKSAASNQQPNQSSSVNTNTSTPQAAPANMASGTANQPFAGLTGARYAGFGNGLPGLDMFGPDGGMGAPMDEARIQRLMSDPNVQQTMNEALNNPDFVNMLIDSNPMLRNIPNAREIITSPFMRQMMNSPEMMSQAMRMQRNMRGGEGAFPAPGATDTTPEGATTGGTAQGNNAQNQQNPFANPFMMPGMAGGQQGGENQPNISQLLQQLQALSSMGIGPFGAANQGQAAGQTTTGQTGSGNTPSQGATDNQSAAPAAGTTPGQGGAQQGSTTSPPPANPFAALFPPPGGAQGTNPFGMNPEMMQQMMSMFGGQGSPAAPPDNRPPEERYEDQLRQLNDMGFFDFDRNVAALRRSGGSVQGAVEYLLSSE
ncbi:deubiquitination-protection dph1 [Fusarium albosuccineum]|uniref:Deubiquitination-protection dph1 n=1 Tax=Fusarium albosuccineum TaxID=1237068 RepID=A0A8H4PCT5_9HYPO|nr:deubiquitination-protection dph1 [Fusarium albosuccineum]